MPRWSKAQESARQQIAALASAALPLATLSSSLMAALRSAVGWDGYRLFGVDSQTLLINSLLASSDNDDWARSEFLNEVYLAAEPLNYIELPFLMRARLPAVAFQDRQDACWGYPSSTLSSLDAAQHTREFHEQRSPVGGSLLASFAGDGRWVASLQAYRREPGCPFQATDVAFVHAIARTIGEALASAMMREQRAHWIEGSVQRASGVLLVSSSGVTRFATPAGEAWLDLLRAQDHAPQGLPTACWAAIADLRRHSAQSASSVGAVSVATAGGPVRVEAAPADADGTIALSFSPERLPLDRPQLPLEWPLTPRERDVAGYVVQGLTNRAVAQALSLGEHTVESHLRQIYGKLEVRSRSQLVARWFRECKLPMLPHSAASMIMPP